MPHVFLASGCYRMSWLSHVHSITFTWDAVYTKVFMPRLSLIGLRMWMFLLTQMWTVLVPFLASRLLIFFEFQYWYGNIAATLVGFLLFACVLLQCARPVWYPHYWSPSSFDIKHNQDQAVLNCLILKMKALWCF